MRNTLLCLCLAATACKEEPPKKAGPPEEAAGPARTAKPGPPARHETPAVKPLAEDEPAGFRTTSSSIFHKNLQAQRANLLRLAKAPSPSATILRQLGGVLHQLAFVTGDLDLYAQALVRFDAVLEGDPANVGARLARARSRRALHDFGGALEDIKVVLELRPRSREAKQARADTLWALGRYGEAIPMLKAGAASTDTQTQAAVSQLLFATGEVDKARRGYASTVARFRGVNPLTVAWLEVQRGVTYLDTGRLPQAKALFEASIDRLEGFTLAEEHLAEVRGLMGDHAGAEALYRKVVERSKDPVFMVELAKALAKQGKTADAKALRAQAAARFEERLASLPAATWQEAAEFHLEGGDGAKALQLAKKNAELRQDAGSLALLARAFARAGRAAEATSAIERALATPIRTVDLFDAAAEVYAAIGGAEQAARWRNEARKLSPDAG